jgi:AraC-like DNA-binding protein
MKDEKLVSQLYLWDKRSLYIGPLQEKLLMTQGAATFTLALDNPASFMCEGMEEPIFAHSLLVPAGLTVTIDATDAIVVNCHLDAVGADYFSLSARMQKKQFGVGYNIVNEEQVIDKFCKVRMAQESSLITYKQLDEWLNVDISGYKIDARVEVVIDKLKQTVEDNISVEELAALVNLSVPRLMEVFKKQTGVPMRRFRLWHRLYITAMKMGEGKSLTEAAVMAGFTDSSHFSRTFRNMFGMAPTAIFSQPNGLKIMTPEY